MVGRGCDIGIVGMGVMAQNLALNIERNGFTVSVYNRTSSKTKEFESGRAKDKNIFPTYTPAEFINSLSRPRKILLMIKAGVAVDSMLEQLLPYMGEGDIIADLGNSHFQDTERRYEAVNKKKISYLGIGISGGEYGALHGPSIMVGGDRGGYNLLEGILTKVAAKSEDGSCCSYLGTRSAGHYIKMVHNGIEYGVMQLIAECYDTMRKLLNMNASQIGDIFKSWNRDELESYLLEITVDILHYREGDKFLIDLISDEAEQKGTGKWAAESAAELGVPIPTIRTAVEVRDISSYREERLKVSDVFNVPVRRYDGNAKQFLSKLKKAYYIFTIASYCQGLHLLTKASKEFEYGTDPSEVLRVWKGGCIIRARIVDMLRGIYFDEPDIMNPLFSCRLKQKLRRHFEEALDVVAIATGLGLPVPAMSSSLNYLNCFRCSDLPTNLIQAQRDYFGAHQYKRIDKEGRFHTIWKKW